MIRLLPALLLVATALTANAADICFEDVARSAGIDFQFHAGSRGRHDLPEIMAGGLALFDADGDGLLDVFLCQGGPIQPTPGAIDPPCRLYRNLGGLKFEDRTATAGIPGPSYAMGVAPADFDGDGRIDLFVTGWRGRRLYRNLGDCRFEDVTVAAGVAGESWTTGAAWADLDGDGDLDLYVAGYVAFDPAAAPYCAAPDGRRDFCAPEDFDPEPDHIYRNDGGRFVDVVREAGLPQREERGLGVLIADFDGDRRPDVFVANDGGRCWMLANRGGLHFEDVAEAAGTARDGGGRALAGMGTAAADLDGDGLIDLAVTNFLGRSTIAFRGLDGRGGFRDESSRLGIAAATREVLGFGVVAADFDADGRIDLLQANGHVLDRARLGVPFAMRPILLQGRAGGFDDASKRGGPWFSRPALGRGLAVGDLDDDGRLDVAAASLDVPFALLVNRTPAASVVHIDLVNRQGVPAIGARVTARIGGRTEVTGLVGGAGYLSSSPPRLTFSLGSASAIETLEIAWPWGGVEIRRDIRPGMPLRIVENAPAVSPDPPDR
ncbi:CRTAC1 family protein [Paludisphaera rhizosphaerae]|uniref:CRTAC1 family protein n=1 Tax=Paludisphaera rhizosphaerae TaxID=2711216 RepID=UPI0013ECCA42|nr:CRTAC1 family protein [Paludisphaera rhizosphaerae]